MLIKLRQDLFLSNHLFPMQMGILEASFHVTSHNAHPYFWGCICLLDLSAPAFAKDHLVSS